MTAPDPQDRLRSLLDRVSTSEAPVDDIVAAGERRRRSRRSRLAAAGAAAAVVVVAGAALAVDQGSRVDETVTYAPPVDLAGDWRVTALYDDAGREVPLDGLSAPVDLTFDPDAGTDTGGPLVSGHDGCNSFGGPYAANGAALTIADGIHATEQACERSVPLIERLGDVSSTREATGDAVELLDPDGDVVVELEPFETEVGVDLEGEWQVTELHDRGTPVSVASGADGLLVEFGPPTEDGEGRWRISDSCNQAEGTYRAQGAEITTEPTGDLRQPSCPGFDTLVDQLPDIRLMTGLGNEELVLEDADRQLVAHLRRAGGNEVTAAGLAASTWKVVQLADAGATTYEAGVSAWDKPVTVEFSDAAASGTSRGVTTDIIDVFGRTGCNYSSGTLTLREGQWSRISGVSTSLAACAGEPRLDAAFRATRSADHTDGLLRLFDGDGQLLMMLQRD